MLKQLALSLLILMSEACVTHSSRLDKSTTIEIQNTTIEIPTTTDPPPSPSAELLYIIPLSDKNICDKGVFVAGKCKPADNNDA